MNSPSFDRTHREPMRALDAIVTGRGTRFTVKTHVKQWEVCPPTMNAPKGTDELRGRKFGRMTVIGLSAELNERWICRCSCGLYEARRAKVIKRDIPGDRCAECMKVAKLRATAIWRASAVWIESNDL